MSKLLEPLQLGAIRAPNRILMAPMTRARGTRGHVPTAIMEDYYAQRASAGWRRITDRVHAAGGRIIAQLWHMGRNVHPSFLGGQPPVSASATVAPSEAHSYDGKQPYVAARALHIDEIPGILEDFRVATRNAMAAGFDGVQIHAANGYLIDQFLRDSANWRTDRYGGSIGNRIRLLQEVTQAVADVAGADRTGVRLSPNGLTQGVRDSDPLPLFSAALETLSSIGIAHLELREPPPDGTFGVGETWPLAAQLRSAFKGPLLLNSDFAVARAEAELATGVGDAVTFGRLFISNPDLPQRIARGLSLSPDDSSTWFTQGAQGYVDYPAQAI